ARVRLLVAWLRSTPDAPSVRELPALIVTAPWGSKILMPAQLVFAPSAAVLGVVMVLSHTAMSTDVGGTPSTQELPRFKLSALSALTTFEAQLAVLKIATVVNKRVNLTFRDRVGFIGIR